MKEKSREKMTLKQLGNGLLGGIIGSVAYSFVAAPLELRHLPRAVVSAYRALYRENRIGPNLKTAVYVISPLGIVIIPPLSITAGVIFGLLRGATSSSEHGIGGLGRDFKDDLAKIDGEVVKSLVSMYDYQPNPLPAGKKPFDISVFQTFKALVASIAAAVIGTPAMTAVAVLRLPRFYIRSVKSLFRECKDDRYFVVLAAVLMTAVIPLVPLLALLAAIFVNLARGGYHGYTEGVGKAAVKAVEDTREVDKWLKNFINKA